jgi:type IX secretion system PorP/SprF family membrane protein
MKAQDNIYSQFYFSPLQLNPALTGLKPAPRITVNYRNQWAGIPNAYSVYSASYDQFVENLNSGFGLAATGDDQGDGIYSTISLTGSYSYNVQVSNKLFARAGFQASYVRTRLDWNRLVFPDQINPITGPVDASGIPNVSQQTRPLEDAVSYADINLGTVIYSENFYAGAALYHANSPSVSFLGDRNGRAIIPMRFSIHAGGEISLGRHNKPGKKAFISPNVLFSHQGGFNQLNIGSYIGYSSVFGGAWLRYTFNNPDAVIFSLGFRTGSVKMGYSYDYTISGLNNRNTTGTHELAMVLDLESDKMKNKRYNLRYNNCLKIFK